MVFIAIRCDWGWNATDLGWFTASQKLTLPYHLNTKSHTKISIKLLISRFKLSLLRLACPWGGGGGVLWISSDGDDRMGVKVKTPKNP